MSTKLEVFLHLVWGTWRRQPQISKALEPALHEAIQTKCVDLRCAPVAIGSGDDHVHVLAMLHSSVSVARLVAEIKGYSAHSLNKTFRGTDFRWQHGYAAFSVSSEDVPLVAQYVREQRHHHALGAIVAELESPEPPKEA
jgi:putative transposase